MSLVRDTIYAFVGLKRLVSFQDNWRECFDVSADGVLRSFWAAALAIPVFVYVGAGFAHMGAELGAVRPPSRLWLDIVEYARIWLVFPIVAALISLYFSRSAFLSVWLVVHNWAVLALFSIQAIVVTIYLSGVLPMGAALAFFVLPYHFIRLGLHWRVATASLNISWGAGAAAASLHVIVDLLAITALAVLTTPSEPAPAESQSTEIVIPASSE